jgi:hypothetical protein
MRSAPKLPSHSRTASDLRHGGAADDDARDSQGQHLGHGGAIAQAAADLQMHRFVPPAAG